MFRPTDRVTGLYFACLHLGFTSSTIRNGPFHILVEVIQTSPLNHTSCVPQKLRRNVVIILRHECLQAQFHISFSEHFARFVLPKYHIN
jgi:hypothetical protein